MKKIIRLTEQDLRRMVIESVNKVLNESISGQYQVYLNGEPRNVYIDSNTPYIRIDDYEMDGDEALYGIEQIKGFLKYNNNGIESAIEQYLYDIER